VTSFLDSLLQVNALTHSYAYPAFHIPHNYGTAEAKTLAARNHAGDPSDFQDPIFKLVF